MVKAGETETTKTRQGKENETKEDKTGKEEGELRQRRGKEMSFIREVREKGKQRSDGEEDRSMRKKKSLGK